MCGRFTLKAPAAILTEYFGIAPLPGFQPRYNIAPSQPVAVVRGHGDRSWSALRWGLIPYWAKDAGIGSRLINARAETVSEKPAYRESFAHRRCLIPADGFYEWQRLGHDRKQPYYVHLVGEEPFAFAGVWDRWRDHDAGSVIESCALITTEPNEVVAPIHDRMPAILRADRFDLWLDPEARLESLQAVLAPFPSGPMRAVPVTRHVNSPRNDDPLCIAPVAPDLPPRTLFD